MNKWKKIVAALRNDHGYKGDESLASVKQFVAQSKTDESEGIMFFEDGSDNPIDLDAVYKSCKPSPARVVISDDPVPPAKDATKNSGGNRAAQADAAAHGIVKGGGDVHRSLAKKSYESRIKSGQAVFSDVDVAESFGAWIRLAALGEKSYPQREQDEEIIAKAGSSFNPGTGGVLIPEEFRATLMYLTEQRGVIRRLFNVQPMSRDLMKVPRVTSILGMVPLSENVAQSDNDAGFDLVEVTAREWGRLVRVPNALLQDAAVSVTDTYARIFAEAQAKAEDDCGTLGDGTSTYNNYRGLASGLVSGAYINGAGNSWSAITEANIQTLVGSAENIDHTRAAFMCSRQFFFQVMAPFATASGRGSQAEFFGVNGSSGPTMGNYKGWPVYFNQSMPTASASASRCLYFGDFAAGATLGDRRQLEIATSEHAYFTSNGFGLRGISRFGINVHGDGRGSTFGPIVCLQTT